MTLASDPPMKERLSIVFLPNANGDTLGVEIRDVNTLGINIKSLSALVDA
jgi:hypothetical protein